MAGDSPASSLYGGFGKNPNSMTSSSSSAANVNNNNGGYSSSLGGNNYGLGDGIASGTNSAAGAGKYFINFRNSAIFSYIVHLSNIQYTFKVKIS